MSCFGKPYWPYFFWPDSNFGWDIWDFFLLFFRIHASPLEKKSRKNWPTYWSLKMVIMVPKTRHLFLSYWLVIPLQVQCSFQAEDSGMGTEVDRYHRDYRELVDRTESLDLLGGCICRWWHRKAVATGIYTVVIPLPQFGSRHPIWCNSKITLK